MPEFYEAGVFMADGFRVRRSMRVHARQPDDPERTHFQWSMCGNQMHTAQRYRGWIQWRRCETDPAPERICTRCSTMLEVRAQTTSAPSACCEARAALAALVEAEKAYQDAEGSMAVLCEPDSDATLDELNVGSDMVSTAALALDAAWDRAHALLAGEEKGDGVR